jgi:aryl-alcohol dehydrogenase-like predicted oxidoreductase
MTGPVIQGYSKDVMTASDDFSTLVRAGAAKHAGVSNATAAQVEAYLKYVDERKTSDTQTGCSVGDIQAHARNMAGYDRRQQTSVGRRLETIENEERSYMPPVGQTVSEEQINAGFAAQKKPIQAEIDGYRASENFYTAMAASAGNANVASSCNCKDSGLLASNFLAQGR